MLLLRYGTKGQIFFSCESELYEALGYLARNCGDTSLNWEKNDKSGVWSEDGRIHFYEDNHKIPGNFLFAAGVGNIKFRTNCNEFIKILRNLYGQLGVHQDIRVIRANIPQTNQSSFDIGLQLGTRGLYIKIQLSIERNWIEKLNFHSHSVI